MKCLINTCHVHSLFVQNKISNNNFMIKFEYVICSENVLPEMINQSIPYSDLFDESLAAVA